MTEEKKPVPAGGKNPGKKSSSTLVQALTFLKEANIERRKITWPAPRDVFKNTLNVIALVIVITLLVLVFDWVLARVIFQPLEHLARTLGGGVPQ